MHIPIVRLHLRTRWVALVWRGGAQPTRPVRVRRITSALPPARHCLLPSHALAIAALQCKLAKEAVAACGIESAMADACMKKCTVSWPVELRQPGEIAHEVVAVRLDAGQVSCWALRDERALTTHLARVVV